MLIQRAGTSAAEHGRQRVALRHRLDRAVRRAGRRRGGAVLRVIDDGPGFSPGFLDGAFERFARSDTGRSTHGSGLGLSIVRSQHRSRALRRGARHQPRPWGVPTSGSPSPRLTHRLRPSCRERAARPRR
ncbi:MAG: sensor histidine kinase [Actinomycetota bacterium]|nr:sensor histidine kinase [Actinomycetota bacterium]